MQGMQSMQKYAKVCKSMQKYTRNIKTSKFRKLCWKDEGEKEASVTSSLLKLRSEKIFGLKQFLVQRNFWDENIFLVKKMLVKKNLG